MPVWPGDPEVRLEWLSQIDEGGAVNLTGVHMCAHTGTHIDTPSHFLEKGMNLDDIDLGTLIGTARVVSVPDEVRSINAAFLKNESLEGVERVLFKTRSCDLVNLSTTDFCDDFVALDASGARFLADLGCKLVGIDTMSIAVFDDPVGGHVPLLEAGILVLEGLDLQEIEPGDYQLIALPIKLGAREGAPVRAVLLEV